MAKTPKLPKVVEDYLDNSLLFNKFGLVNISALLSKTGTKLTDADLKAKIQARFGHEMSNGQVEFVEKTTSV